METENGAELAALQQGIPAGREACATGLGEPDGLLGIRRDVGIGMVGREERFCWRGGDFSQPARVG